VLSPVEIIFADHSFYLPEVPIETISDFEIAKMPFISMTPRRRGLQFGELTHHQMSELEYFIQNHTTGEAKVNESPNVKEQGQGQKRLRLSYQNLKGCSFLALH